jgi:outer membrane protein W
MHQRSLVLFALLLSGAMPAWAQKGHTDLIIDAEGVRSTGSTEVGTQAGASFDPRFRTGGGLGVGLDYYMSQHVSLEGKVSAIVSDVRIVSVRSDTVTKLDLGHEQLYPVTALLKWHFTPTQTAIQPYIGAGVGHVILRNIDRSDLARLGASEIRFDDPTGLVVAAGLVFRTSRRWGFSADARYIPLETKSTVTAVGSATPAERINLKPLIVSFGIAYRF